MAVEEPEESEFYRHVVPEVKRLANLARMPRKMFLVGSADSSHPYLKRFADVFTPNWHPRVFPKMPVTHVVFKPANYRLAQLVGRVEKIASPLAVEELSPTVRKAAEVPWQALLPVPKPTYRAFHRLSLSGERSCYVYLERAQAEDRPRQFALIFFDEKGNRVAEVMEQSMRAPGGPFRTEVSHRLYLGHPLVLQLMRVLFDKRLLPFESPK